MRQPTETSSAARSLSMRGKSATAAIALLSWGLTGTVAQAHPHIFINVEMQLIFDKGNLAAIKELWTFDEIYTAQAMQGLPSKVPGIYTREDLAELAKANVQGMKEFEYFTLARTGPDKIAFGEATAASMDYIDVSEPPGPASIYGADLQPLPGAPQPAPQEATRRTWLQWAWQAIGGKADDAAPDKSKVATLEFTMPLKVPVPAAGLSLDISVADPTVFIWFEYAKKNGVTLGGDVPAFCKLEVKDPGGSAFVPPGTPMSGPDAPPPGFGFAASKIAQLRCPK